MLFITISEHMFPTPAAVSRGNIYQNIPVPLETIRRSSALMRIVFCQLQTQLTCECTESIRRVRLRFTQPVKLTPLVLSQPGLTDTVHPQSGTITARHT